MPAGQVARQLFERDLLRLRPLDQVEHVVFGDRPREATLKYGGHDRPFGSNLSESH
jgi:hypothetical protein